MEIASKFNYEEELKNCKSVDDIVGKNGLIKKLIKNALESLLDAELENHLGYKKHEAKGKNSGNSRNGSSSKNIKSSYGEVEIDIPRDRNGEFEPAIIKKHERDISEFDEKIIGMYSKGMSTRDIQTHITELYGVEISPSLVSSITDKVQHLVSEWQSKALANVYAVAFFDAIHYKVRENGKIISKAAYTCLGVDVEGKKEILGVWIGENEGAKFWLSVFNQLKNRGVKDILIACMDGLKGLPEALKAVFPDTEIQLCIVHMIRNSMKFVGSKNQKEFIKDLKTVYQAPSETDAVASLDILKNKWKQYPLAISPWYNNWENLSAYFKYPDELRRIIYTTNAVESVHRQYRKVTKNRVIFPNDESLLKLLFLASRDMQKKWTMPVRDWSIIISQLHIIFEDRVFKHEA
jgi:transposase-like protein